VGIPATQAAWAHLEDNMKVMHVGTDCPTLARALGKRITARSDRRSKLSDERLFSDRFSDGSLRFVHLIDSRLDGDRPRAGARPGGPGLTTTRY